MFILTILFNLLLISSAAEPQRQPSNITLGSSLTPSSNSSWPSPSGVYAFGFFPQHVNSYTVGIFLPDKTVVWTANRNSGPTAPDDVISLLLSPDGRLILRQRQGQNEDVISLSATIASASMLDNGNFVLYDSNSIIIWQSRPAPSARERALLQHLKDRLRERDFQAEDADRWKPRAVSYQHARHSA